MGTGRDTYGQQETTIVSKQARSIPCGTSEPIGRLERRRWGNAYVRGLLMDGERKSIEPMAARLPDGNVQAMQQFVGQSPWDHSPVRKKLAERMVDAMVPAVAWIVDDTGFPKQGKHSVGLPVSIRALWAKWETARLRYRSIWLQPRSACRSILPLPSESLGGGPVEVETSGCSGRILL